MQVYTGHVEAAAAAPVGAVALGNFDGVHLGHRELVRRARAHAARLGGPAVVFTFEPHPTRVLAPRLAPPLIMPLAQRLEALEALGVDAVVLEPFTAALARMSAQAFVTEVLAGAMRVRAAVVGYNFTFGHKRSGNPALLTQLGQTHGFEVDVVPEVTVDGMACSSTKVRELLLEGNVRGATMVLGKPFCLQGVVVKGHQRGRTLGFATANVETSVELLPRPGVYAATVRMIPDHAGAPWPAVVNVGTAPTFGGSSLTVEAHLLDRTVDVYGKQLAVDFVERLRGERRFDGSEALKAQIAVDVSQAWRVHEAG